MVTGLAVWFRVVLMPLSLLRLQILKPFYNFVPQTHLSKHKRQPLSARSEQRNYLENLHLIKLWLQKWSKCKFLS